MKKRIIITCVAFLSLVAVFVGGFALGWRDGQRVMMPFQRSGAAGNLSFLVEALTRLRTGDDAGATAMMEGRVDAAILSMPRNEPWSELQYTVQRALVRAKAYRTAFPPEKLVEELEQALEIIPMLRDDEFYGDALLQKLAELSRSPSAETGEDDGI